MKATSDRRSPPSALEPHGVQEKETQHPVSQSEQRINELLQNMMPDQAERAVDLLQRRDDLMELNDDYA